MHKICTSIDNVTHLQFWVQNTYYVMLDLRPSFFFSVLARMNCGYEMHKASFCIKDTSIDDKPFCNFGYKIHTMLGTNYLMTPMYVGFSCALDFFLSLPLHDY